MRSERAPEFDGGFDGHGLLDLAEVNEIGKALRDPEVPAEHVGDLRVAVRVALVPFHDRGAGVQLVGGRIPANHLERWERLEAELRAKPWVNLVVVIESF